MQEVTHLIHSAVARVLHKDTSPAFQGEHGQLEEKAAGRMVSLEDKADMIKWFHVFGAQRSLKT